MPTEHLEGDPTAVDRFPGVASARRVIGGLALALIAVLGGCGDSPTQVSSLENEIPWEVLSGHLVVKSGSDLFLLDPQNRSVRVIATSVTGYHFTLSPDLLNVAFSQFQVEKGTVDWEGDWDIRSIPIGEEAVSCPRESVCGEPLVATTRHESWPGWSDDGRLAYTAERRTEIGDFRLHKGIYVDGTLAHGDTLSAELGTRASWAPDGTLVVPLREGGSGGGNVLALYRIDPDTKESTVLIPEVTRMADFRVSPDGAWVAFTKQDVDGKTVWVSSVDGSEMWPLASGRRPVWSPDGTQILYVATESEGEATRTALYVADVDGDEPVRVMEAAWADWR